MTGSPIGGWLEEPVTPFARHHFAITRTVCRHQTQHQEAQILETPEFGRLLVLDGRIQLSEADAFIYHEALVHPGLLLLPQPRAVLIVGGGPGATPRQVLLHPSVETVVLVDIDREVVELCRSELPAISGGAFEDPRLEVRFEDATRYLETTSRCFDAVIVDLTAPIEDGPARALWSREFFALIHQHLAPDGVMTTHGGSASPAHLGWLTAMVRTLETVFPVAVPYLSHIPCFGLGNPWAFVLCSNGRDPRTAPADVLDGRLRQLDAQLQYWDRQTQAHAFNLPRPIRRALAGDGEVLSRSAPRSWTDDLAGHEPLSLTTTDR